MRRIVGPLLVVTGLSVGWAMPAFADRARNGVEEAGPAKAATEFGPLVGDRTYKGFTMRLKFGSLKGNSGLYFRVAVGPRAFSGLSGFQVEIDPRTDVGGLYETNGRAWVVQPGPEDVKKYFKPDDWNEMTVSARGGDITVTVNGTKTAEWKGDEGKWTEGPFALQAHGGQDGLVYFKGIEIQEESAK